MTRSLWGLAALLALSVGCTTVESDSVLTSGMYARMSANSAGEGDILVTAVLTVGQGSTTFVELSDGDSLSASVGEGSPVAMSYTEVLDFGSYSATLPGGAADDAVLVAFARSVDAGAPSSTATLPAPFEMGAAPEGASRAAAITLTWDGAGDDPMTLAVTGACIEGYDQAVEDTGTVTLPAGALVAIAGSEASSCEVTAAFTRTREGTADPAFEEGGEFTATQTREIRFEVAP